jgi:hypothetical protein
MLGGGPSKSFIDAGSRGRVFRTVFAERPARIETLEQNRPNELIAKIHSSLQQQ